MKTAKEMFEELGYKLVVNANNNIYYKKDDCKWIIFSNTSTNCYIKANIFIDDKKYETVIDLKELKAINKQIEELGWLDD